MKKRLVILSILIATSGCANQSPSTDAKTPDSSTQTAASPGNDTGGVPITTADGLKFILEQAGITNVHPVQNGDKLGAWAIVPALKGCPVYVNVVSSTEYSITHLATPDGKMVPMDMGGTALSPSAADLAKWALTNGASVMACTRTDATAFPSAAP